MTSSEAAVTSYDKPQGYEFTEEDWNTKLTLKEPYPYSKTMAEKTAWEFVNSLPEDKV
jgi:dihydroflavonol-4-reductase